MPIDVKAGEVVYLKQEVEMGFAVARNSLKVLAIWKAVIWSRIVLGTLIKKQIR